jgi:HSP20 family protein
MEMTLLSWSPLREFDDIFNRYNRSTGGRLLPGEGSQEIAAEWRPLANISETDSEYLIKVELPEIEKKDVNVAVNDGVITIKGERRLEKDSEDETQHRIESFYGSFSRSFSLPADVDESGIRAESKNGVLKVHLPKTEVQQPKSIEIKVK